ncbi:putative tyrosine phosphatase protein [Botrytis fragariae]|uniref:Putative tyrosine phosphatase protein n=1 Tax=Botrytis fragariae TaxID=1964551 RepID=A0A8H6ATS7_9HELO|nr:putative tyrosine phosphatase protein [Botrytis fragariae]KAF5873519.1 putative tyrosine phosphatase protein [Botrytis fragariae]
MHGEGILKEYKNGIQKVFEKIGEIEGLNILFHCTAGKDRTGVILVFFGASEEEIALDYALTRIGTESHRERLLQGMLKWVGEKGLEQPGLDDLSSAKGENIVALLHWMDVEWGSDVEQNVNCCEHVGGRKWSGVEG